MKIMPLDKQKRYPSTDKPWMKYYNNEKSKSTIDINKSVFDFAYQLNKDHLEEPGINYYGKIISKRKFFETCIKYGRGLYSLGVREKDVVSILMPTMPHTYFLLYGCDYIGAIVNPIDIRTSIGLIKKYINETKSTCLFIHELMASNMLLEDLKNNTTLNKIVVMPSPSASICGIKRSVGKSLLMMKHISRKYSNGIIPYYEFKNLCNNEYGEEIKRKGDPKELSVLMHTSGTTGDCPKTVMANDININFMASQYMKSLMNLDRCMISIDIMPKWIFYGYLGIHMPLCIGMTVVPIADPVHERLSEIINRFQPQSVAGVPGHAMDLLDNNNVKDLSCLTTIGIGGDAIPLESERRLNELLQKIGRINYCSPGYGASENTSIATANQGDVYKLGSVGIPFYDVNFMVIDKDKYEQNGEIVEIAYNQEGILCFGGNLMLGYYGEGNLETNNVIKEYYGENWYISEDVGYIDEDGFVFFLNREKDIIVLPDGFKVVPKAIEDIVSMNPCVKQCVVIAKKYKSDSVGERPCCYVVLKRKKQIVHKRRIEKLIRDSINKNLSSYYMPREIIFVNHIEMTSMGKINRKKYRES